MRHILYSFSLAALVTAGLAGCVIEPDLEGFQCNDETDCLPGYVCQQAPGGSATICLPDGAVGPNCTDEDGDGFQFGTGCAASVVQDCNDNDFNINPSATELCVLDEDGQPIDENCDGVYGRLADDSEITQPCRFQAGFCENSYAVCVNDEFPECEGSDDPSGYPPEFGQEICDGIDNNCNDRIDEGANCCDIDNPTAGCTCQVGQSWECGLDTGECTRGIQVCVAANPGDVEGTLSPCLAATIGSPCSAAGSDECGPGAYCVTEVVSPLEDLHDDCYNGTEDVCADTGCPSNCERTVCRALVGDVPCTAGGAECGDGETCLDGFCRPPRVGVTGEICNGLDDNCDGRIDNDGDRIGICGNCPYNMVFYQTGTGGASDFRCIDRYEASLLAGDDGLYAVSVPGVQPLTNISPEDAEALCQAEPYAQLFQDGFSQPIPTKLLCRTIDYTPACAGVAGTASETDYPYGDTFVAGACADGTVAAGAQPTGAFDTCGRYHGANIATDPNPELTTAYDLTGNVAEWVEGAGGFYFAAGGSYLDSEPTDLLCSSQVAAELIPGGTAAHVGFRCCTLPAR